MSKRKPSKRAYKKARVVPGYTRTGGSYGRYSGRNAELKFYDNSTNFAFDATGEIPVSGQLVEIPQGVTESTRVGRKCVIKSVQGKYALNFIPGAATASSTYVFMYLVLDKQCNGAAAAVTDVFESSAVAYSPLNLNNSQRFRILKKFKAKLTSQAGVSGAFNKDTAYWEFYKKCNIPLEFSSTTGAITEIRSNNLFLIAGSDNQSDDTVNCVGITRVRFSDGS